MAASPSPRASTTSFVNSALVTGFSGLNKPLSSPSTTPKAVNDSIASEYCDPSATSGNVAPTMGIADISIANDANIDIILLLFICRLSFLIPILYYYDFTTLYMKCQRVLSIIYNLLIFPSCSISEFCGIYDAHLCDAVLDLYNSVCAAVSCASGV